MTWLNHLACIFLLLIHFLFPVCSHAVTVARAPLSNFVPPQSGDSVEFQTILQAWPNTLVNELCPDPVVQSAIFSDSADPNSFFFLCSQGLLYVTTNVQGNETSTIDKVTRLSTGASILQILAIEQTTLYGAFAQTTDSRGRVLVGLTATPNTFGLYDRFGVQEPQLLWSSMSRSADSAVTFAHDDTLVCWVCLNTQTSTYSDVVLTRLNYSSPSSSVEVALPLNITGALTVYIAAHPTMPLLYVYVGTQLTEYNIATNTSRMIVNFPPTFIDKHLAQLAFTDSDHIILAAFDHGTAAIQANMPFVFRIHLDTLAYDTIVTAEQCGGYAGGITNLLFAAKQQLLFIVCTQSRLLAASFTNGTIADPSSVATFHIVTTPLLAVGGVILLDSDTKLRLLLYNVGQLDDGLDDSEQPWSLVATSGMSLASTINQLECGLPLVISAQRDEFQRQILLHSCGIHRIPTVTIDGVAYPLDNVCSSFDTLLHRPGTSEVYMHCTPPTSDNAPMFVASVHTDNSQPRILFTCPEPQLQFHYNAPATMTANVVLARNNSLVITCTYSLWLLPLDGAGSARMLLNLNDSSIVGPVPVDFVNGAQATSTVAFVSVQYTGGMWGKETWMAVITASLDDPPLIPSWRTPAFDWMLDENNTAAFHDVQVYSGDDLISIIIRQDLHADGTPAANYSVFSTTPADLMNWKVDSFSRKLIVVLFDGGIWIVDAYAQYDYPTARLLSAPPGCVDPDQGLTGTSNSVYMTFNRRLDQLLFSCPLLVGADWLLMAIASDVLRNASSPVVWTPFLRGTPTCRQITGDFVTSDDGMQMFLQCDIAQALTVNFQCSPGQQWSLGQCRSCLPGTSKNVWNASSVDSVYAIPQCVSCPKGSIAVASAAFTCMACPVGTFHDVSLGEVCRPCPAGRYANESGMNNCPACPSGTVQPSLASSTCTSCPLGSLADSNAVTCIPCARGWYTPTAGANARCVTCEGPHQNGLNCSYGMASVEEGYFAYLVQDPLYDLPIYRTAICPANHCPGSPLQVPTQSPNNSVSTSTLWSNCPVPDDDVDASTIQYCCWPRVNSAANLLCAQCTDGFIPWGSSCVSCDGPNGVLISGLLLFALLVVAWLFSNTQAQATEKQSATGSPPSPIIDTSTTGHVALLLYFVQISSVQLGRTTSDWIQWLHFSNLSAQSSRDCIAPLDPYQQTALNLAIPIILIGVLVFLACMHLCFDRCRRGSADDAPEDIRSLDDSELHMRVALDSAAESRRQPLVQHDDMYGIDGNERMYSPALAKVAEAPPVELQLSRVIQSLYGCYQRDAYYWNSLVLLRRMLFAVAAVFLSDNATTRNGVFVLLHFGSLLLHQLALPYKLTALNRMEVVTYSILLLQAVLLLMQDSPPPYTTWFEICMLLLVILPVLFVLGWMIRTKFGIITAKSDEKLCKRICSQVTLPLPSSFSSGRYIATIISIFLFSYTSVTSTVFTFLRCVNLTDIDVSVVFQTPTMQCGSDRYKRYQLWVLVVLCIYVIGFPLISLALLAWKRKQQSVENEKHHGSRSDVSNF